METLTVREIGEGQGFLSSQNRDLFLKNRSKENDNDIIINFAYSDYGGSFFDKVCIEYFKKYYPGNILVENTAYFGENAILYGMFENYEVENITEAFVKSCENYLLGFMELEEFYYNKVNELETEAFEYFIKDELENYYDFDKEEVLEYLRENKSGYYSIYYTMLDFNSTDLINELENAGLIKKLED